MLARALAIAMTLAVLAPRAAYADEASSARELYERGIRFYNLQQFDAALDAFQGAYSIERPEFLFNIAQCQRQLRQYEAAARSYRAFVASFPGGPDSATASRLAQEMDAQAAAASAPKAAAATAAQTPTATAAEPEPIGARATAAPVDRGRSLRVAGVAAGAAGLALLAVGATCAGLSYRAAEDAWRGPVYSYRADQQRVAYQTAEIALFTVGGAVAVAGVTLWAVGRRRRR